jgi:hypothetical protein
VAVAVPTVISLASSNPSVLSVPATVTIQPGNKSATFTVTSSAVAHNTSVNVSTSGTNGSFSTNVTVQS